MSFVRLSATVWFAATAVALAQGGLSVEVELEQEQFLPKEDMRVAVRITNFSGQTLELGEGNWLRFSIEARDNHIVRRIGDPWVEEAFSLGSSMTATVRVNLTPYFDFQKPGHYTVTAAVRVPRWEQAIESKPKPFDVISGTKLREFEFGVPSAAGTAPEVRRYVLQQATYLKQLRLYCRVTDGTGGFTHRVVPIAHMVSFSRPETQLDRSNKLHVLHQIGARTFNYSVINPDGDMLVRQTHEYARTRPALRVNSNGTVEVTGGARRISPSDLPSATLETSPSVAARVRDE